MQRYIFVHSFTNSVLYGKSYSEQGFFIKHWSPIVAYI